jgi:type IV pilus assembly protein PilN
MIRINLLGVERKAAGIKRAPVTFQAGQMLTVGCSAILVVAALVVGWRYWTLQKESAQIDKEISDAQQETLRLHAIILQVQQFEQQRAQLQQRVVLIEQLRKSQSGPVHMLDQISRALPPMLWLTEVKQSDDSVLIDGRCMAVTSLADFVTSLEMSGYFKKSIDIVSSQTEPMAAPPGELVRFTIKATFQQPGEKAPKQGG